ncbi:hypothetical protein OAK74_00595 [bacterium]|jgi:hypothetical protein|nr:hypothetical protein [bacterium]
MRCHTNSSADRSLSEGEQCRRIHEADLEIRTWINKIDTFKGLVARFESESMRENLIQKYVDAVYANQVFSGMIA